MAIGNAGTGNLIVEGDNLVALKALLPYYAGQVKCVYIDPPYNTGNEGWAYNDNVNSPIIREWLGQIVGKEGETLDRHDRWLSMMYPRVALLRQLLREDGAIFISIDDNEVHSLRFLLNEIFGEHNFIGTIIWQKMDSPKNTAVHLSEDHDYIVVYAKNAEVWRPNKLARTEEMKARYKNPDKDPRGPWLLSDLAARNFYAAGRYPLTTRTGRVIDGPPAGSYWRVSEEKFRELERDNRIWWGKTGEQQAGDQAISVRGSIRNRSSNSLDVERRREYPTLETGTQSDHGARCVQRSVPHRLTRPKLLQRFVQIGHQSPANSFWNPFAGARQERANPFFRLKH